MKVISSRDNRPVPLIRLGIGLILFCAALVMGTGCTVYEQPAPVATYDQPAPPPPVPAPAESYQPPPPEVTTVYESDLNPYGSWVVVEGYGRCWAPNDRPAGWQPYTVGYWANTDYGWTWVAVDDESQWGDVTYHYGRWYSAPSVGWVWIPGTTWAPAWVAWREGGGYCGWAPLPPQAGFGTEYSADVANRYVPPAQYIYCDERYATTGRVDQHIVHNDVTIINNTTNITNITYVNNHVVNQGMSVENVARATGRPVQRETLPTATTPDEARKLAAAGKPVIYAPPKVQQAEKQRVAKTKTTAENPKPRTPPENPQPPAESAGKQRVEPNEPNPSNADNGAADAKQRKQPSADQSDATAKAKADQDQAAANAKAAADAKAKAAADANAEAAANAKADADAKAKAAADAKAQAAADAREKAAADAKAKAAADARAKAAADAKAKAAAAKKSPPNPPN